MCEPTRTIVARICGTRAPGQITDQVGLRDDSRAAHATDQAHAQSGSTRRVDAVSFFINDARGGLIEAEALAKALLTGHLPALHWRSWWMNLRNQITQFWVLKLC